MSKEQVPEEIRLQIENECENQLVEEILSEFRKIGIDTSKWEYNFGDGNSAPEFIRAGIAAHLEKISSPAQPNPQTAGEVPAISPGGGAEGILYDNLMKILTEVENAHLGHDHEKCFKAIWQYANNVIDKLATLRQPSGTVVYVPVSVEDELPTEKSICFRGDKKLYFEWAGEDLKELKVTKWLKPITLPEREEAVSIPFVKEAWTSLRVAVANMLILPEGDLDGPYVCYGNKMFTKRQLADEVMNSTKDGVHTMELLIKLTIDLVKRGKQTIPTGEISNNLK